jgi:murein DD-endopeptidase MepM/ murein hydrolase activator NlpD
MTVIGGGWRNPAGSDPHAGVDIRLNEGTPVFAIGDGVVTSASATPAGDLGIFAAIAHASGVVSRYLHFSQLLVAPGQTVRKGQQIGLSGNTGNSAAPHLHLDLKVPDQGVLAQVAAEVGEPATGFEPNKTGFGFGIPAEPWIPADRYDDVVKANAEQNGIPLYRPRGVALAIALGMSAGLAFGLYKLIIEPGEGR